MFTTLSLAFSNKSVKERVMFEICLYAPFFKSETVDPLKLSMIMEKLVIQIANVCW